MCAPGRPAPAQLAAQLAGQLAGRAELEISHISLESATIPKHETCVLSSLQSVQRSMDRHPAAPCQARKAA